MIDELYQESINRSLDLQMEMPGPNRPPKVATFAKAWSGFGGALAGGLEAAAGGLEAAGGYGQVTAAGGATSGGGMFATPSSAEAKQNNEAHAKLMREGVDMTDETADALRRKATEFMPDPQSTGAAGQVIGGLTRFGVKAVGYMGTMGPAGALPLGVDEGLTESDRLKQQGVDYNTRTKAGIVAGGVSGVSMLAPMSGATALVRFGKGAAVGEGAMVGQQEAEKLILEHQHYDQIASTYDPFDPVALAVGLIPGVLGAALGHPAPPKPAARPNIHDVVQGLETGGLADPGAAVSAKGAEGAMQVMPATQLDPGFGVRPAKLGPDGKPLPGERERVGHDYLDAMLKHYGGDYELALAAYNAGPGALDAALAHGDDWLAHLPQETQAYVAKGMGRMHVAETAARDPEAVAAARTMQSADALDAARLTPDEDLAGADRHTQSVSEAAEQLGRDEPVRITEQPERFSEDGAASLAELAQRHQEMLAERAALGELPVRPNHAAFEEARAAAESTSRDTAPSAPPTSAEPAAAPRAPGAGAEPVAAPHLDAITNHLEATNPDMLVHLDGMAKPVRIADLMEQLREEAAQTGRSSKLIEVAAQCAMRS